MFGGPEGWCTPRSTCLWPPHPQGMSRRGSRRPPPQRFEAGEKHDGVGAHPPLLGPRPPKIVRGPEPSALGFLIIDVLEELTIRVHQPIPAELRAGFVLGGRHGANGWDVGIGGQDHEGRPPPNEPLSFLEGERELPAGPPVELPAQ